MSRATVWCMQVVAGMPVAKRRHRTTRDAAMSPIRRPAIGSAVRRSRLSATVCAALTVLTVGACGDDTGDSVVNIDEPTAGRSERAAPRECEAQLGTAIDVAHEPDWRQHAPYRPWTDRAGCLVRIDVLAERPGPVHCGSDAAAVLITGRPLGERYTSAADALEFVRDPAGAFGHPALSEGFEADATVPETAIDSGFRRDDLELWHVPNDASSVWLVGLRRVERWPAGTPPVCS